MDNMLDRRSSCALGLLAAAAIGEGASKHEAWDAIVERIQTGELIAEPGRALDCDVAVARRDAAS